jgi:hypothetical protein
MRRTKRHVTVTLSVALMALMGILTGVGMTAPASAAVCEAAWDSLDKSGGTLSPAPIFTSRVGQQTCYDSFVVEVNGPASGYRVGYTDEVYSEGQGLPLSPYIGPHGALIGIHLLDPAYDINTGQSTYPYRPTQRVANVTGFQTFRGVVYGGSFESNTTFALGVRARLPFQVLVLPGPGTHTRFVINVRHRWGPF